MAAGMSLMREAGEYVEPQGCGKHVMRGARVCGCQMPLCEMVAGGCRCDEGMQACCGSLWVVVEKAEESRSAGGVF